MYDRGAIMSEEERLKIKNWCLSVCSTSKILSFYRACFALNPNDKSIPPIIFEIKRRIIEKEKLTGFQEEPRLKDFVAFILPGGRIPMHKDPNDAFSKLYHVRFNIFIETPRKGCATYYGGTKVTAIPGNYVFSRSGIDEHWSDRNEDIRPRISLSFGYLLPYWKVNELCANKSIGIYDNDNPLPEKFLD
jgi:hypothetical protein